MAGPIVFVMPALQYVHQGAPPRPPPLLDQILIII
uniref:UDP-galactose transporter n=1 Tax=Rhizophora mucronata TaxID=61149 RepID=A0A2P2L0D1_RHIMU